MGGCVWSLFCYAVLIVLSRFFNHLADEDLLYLPSYCHVSVSVLCLFLMVPWIVLQCVIVSFPGHTHLCFDLPKIFLRVGVSVFIIT